MLLTGDLSGHLSPVHSLQSSNAPYFTTLAVCVPLLQDGELQEAKAVPSFPWPLPGVGSGTWCVLNRACQNGRSGWQGTPQFSQQLIGRARSRSQSSELGSQEKRSWGPCFWGPLSLIIKPLLKTKSCVMSPRQCALIPIIYAPVTGLPLFIHSFNKSQTDRRTLPWVWRTHT